MAGLEDHPNVFSFEGRLWVSELPAAEMKRQLVEQRAWDSATNREQKWWVAIIVGALIGVVATLGVGVASNIAPVAYLITLPLGFGVGAVLGALVNRRILRGAVPATRRPVIAQVTRIPASVARNAPTEASAKELIEWSKRGYVG